MNGMRSQIRSNWKSGLTVSLISIPLSVSLAVASGASPVLGIITAIWAGIVASIFGGSNYNIVGPTGALSGVLATYAIVHGANSFGALAIVSGIIILLAYFLRLQKYIVLVPACTIHGFTLGVAFIIALNQFNFAFGLSGLKVHEKFIDNVIESFSHISLFSPTALSIFAIFLIGLFLFKKFLPKLPGAIILAPVGIVLGFLSHAGYIPLTIQTLGLKYPDISPTLWNFVVPEFSLSMIVPAITVALIAILETMISAKIADGMTKTKHNGRKEMFGLGLANIVSGIFGGMPATAALARTSLNIKTGATHKTSAGISSVFIVVISFIFLPYFKFIPLPVIASILVYVAIQMLEAEHFVKMFRVDKKTFAVSLLVAMVTIVEDPIWGILVGVAISLLMYVEELTKGQFELVLNENKKIVGKMSGSQIQAINKKTDTLVYSIKGHLDYINGQAHIARFERKLVQYKNVVLRMREVYFVDLDGIDVFDEIIEIIQAKNRKVLVTGVSPIVETMLNHSHNYPKMKEKGLVYEKTSDGLRSLGFNDDDLGS